MDKEKDHEVNRSGGGGPAGVRKTGIKIKSTTFTPAVIFLAQLTIQIRK